MATRGNSNRRQLRLSGAASESTSDIPSWSQQEGFNQQDYQRKYSEMAGNMNMFKSQLTEINKRISRMPQVEVPEELEKLRKETTRLKQELVAVKTELGQTAKHGSLQQLYTDMAQVKNELSQTATHGSLQQLYSDMTQVKTDLGKTATHGSLHQLYTDIERVKTDLSQTAKHGSIQDLYADMARIKQEISQTAQHSSLDQLRADVAQVKSELGQTAKNSNVQQMQNALKTLQNDVKEMGTMKKQLSDMMNDIKAETNKAKQFTQEMQKTTQDMQKTKQEMTQAHKQISQAQKEMDQKATQMKNALDKEIKGTSQKQSQQEREIAEVKKIMTLPHEFRELKQTLNDLGVLKPPNLEPEPGEPPPVGTIALAEDCFSSRLLIKIGYIKAKAERHKAAHEAKLAEKGDSESESGTISTDEEEDAALLDACGNVHGLQPPEIEENAEGYGQVTYGVIWICIFTLVLQLLIVLVLVHYGMTPTECYDEEPTRTEWFILHGSKAAAIIVAGLLMGKDFMDIVNESMVSILIEPKIDIEMAIISFLRFTLSILIGFANLFMFEGFTSPFSVWLNMAALAFVAELGGAMNDQCVKGVFGHAIRSTITSLNYELTFVKAYPWWVRYVQGGTILFVVIFIVISAILVVTKDDPMCPI